jgi:predicted metal-dependent hydrolase
VRVAAPKLLDDDQVRLAVVHRLSWIRKQQDQLKAVERQSLREMVSGESHFVWGVRCRLKVAERHGRAHAELDGTTLLLYVPVGTDSGQRRALLDRWYRVQLRQAVPEVLKSWEPKVGVSVPKWSIRRMKTKWGSCNRETGHIWFNVELAKKDPESLEYLAVHEMTHLIERGHGERFTSLMDKQMPDWRARRDRLNQSPLGHEQWVRP